jgi:hypothetical protein
LALILTSNSAVAINTSVKINGGKGCFMGDCSKQQGRPAVSCSHRAESCRMKNVARPGTASQCEAARLACLKTGTFVTLSGESITGTLRE